MLAKLLECESYYCANNMLTSDGSFYFTTEEACNSLCIKQEKQRKVIDKLDSLGLIKKSKRVVSGKYNGHPLRYIRINHETVKRYWDKANTEKQVEHQKLPS